MMGFEILNAFIGAAGLLLASLPFLKNIECRKAALYRSEGVDSLTKFQAKTGRVTETTGVAT